VSAELPCASIGPFALPGAELCVHCGFCLQACPTYLALEDENDSPRGRIVLMRAMADGQIPVTDPDAQRHLDQCLGCRGCETACPSGVPYGQLLETTREKITERRPLPFVPRVILAVFARPALLSLAMFSARVLRASGIPRLLAQMPGSPGFAMAMIASTSRSHGGGDLVPARPTKTTGPGTVATLDGCVMEGLFANANRATERTLVNNGYRLAAADGQRCCGALHTHAGDGTTARELARANIAAFEAGGAEFIGVNSAGCGAMMKEYGHLLHDDRAGRGRATAMSAKVRDISELLAAVGPKHGGMLPGAPKVAYDAPCHLQHGQRVTAPPMAVLNAIEGLRLVTLVDSDQCCGSAGIYNLIEPDISNRVLDPKLARIVESGASIVATGNPGCLMQIGAGLIRSGIDARAMHPVELLDASYRGGR
jgi:glycolate oxidase iron-sulfur subunit